MLSIFRAYKISSAINKNMNVNEIYPCHILLTISIMLQNSFGGVLPVESCCGPSLQWNPSHWVLNSNKVMALLWMLLYIFAILFSCIGSQHAGDGKDLADDLVAVELLLWWRYQQLELGQRQEIFCQQNPDTVVLPVPIFVVPVLRW